MKITVLVSPSKKNSIPRIKDFFDRRYIASSYYIIDSEWTLNGEMELTDILRKSYDFLIVCDTADLDKRWIPYISGYSQERTKEVLRRINTIFFLENPVVPLPRWLKNFALVNSFTALDRYLKEIINTWHRMDDMLAANRFLEIIGFNNMTTPILIGDSEKDLMLLELYIERGGSPNHMDEKGVPLISKIIRKDEPDLASHILTRGCDVNLVSQDRGTTPLMEAASSGKQSLVRQMLEMGAELDHESKEGQTALILAIGNRHLDTARILIDAGAETSHKDSLGMTALKYAQLYGYQELVEMLEEGKDG